MRVYYVPYNDGKDDAVKRRKWVGTQAQARAYVKSLSEEYGSAHVGGFATVDAPTTSKAAFVKWLNDMADLDNANVEAL